MLNGSTGSAGNAASVELHAERTEATRLHLDQLAVGTDEVDDEPAHRHLQAVARLGQQRLHGRVKWTLT